MLKCQRGSTWASSIIIDRRWPGVSPAALWKILYSISPGSQRGPEAQLCQTSGRHGGWGMWAPCAAAAAVTWPAEWWAEPAELSIIDFLHVFMFIVELNLSRLHSRNAHINQSSGAGLLGWKQRLSFLLVLKHQITSDQSSLHWPPADISINCNIWLVFKLCCKSTLT